MGVVEILGVADEVVEEFVHPEGAGAMEEAVGLEGGEGFPGVEDGVEGVGWDRGNKDVDVVGHEAPGEEVVTGGVEVVECGGDEVGDVGVLEVAVAVALVEMGVEGFGDLADPGTFEVGEVSLHVSGGIEDVAAFAEVGVENFLRKRVGEAEGDGVGGAGGFPVREVATRAGGVGGSGHGGIVQRRERVMKWGGRVLRRPAGCRRYGEHGLTSRPAKFAGESNSFYLAGALRVGLSVGVVELALVRMEGKRKKRMTAAEARRAESLMAGDFLRVKG
jgi:hypothetical protein